MRFILISNKYYPYDDKDFDRFFNQILLDNPEYKLKENYVDIKCNFVDNIEDFFDDIPVDEDTDYRDIIEGFNEYIDWLLTL